MNITQIETNIQSIFTAFSKETFIYDFLLAYGTPNSTIQKLKIGTLNLSKIDGEISWKKKLFFKVDLVNDLHDTIDEIKNLETLKKDTPRFIIVTDYEDFLAYDTKTLDTLDIKIVDLITHYSFFLPLAGMEKAQHQIENSADIKAAIKMAKLFDEINKDNPTETKEEVHNLNVFLSRLLFCYFAEDTGIFSKNQFTHSIKSFTQEDGSDLSSYLDTLFEVMNTPVSSRSKLPNYLSDFPYVNGGLFRNKHTAPTFTKTTRNIVIEIGSLAWEEINPDIFGSMIQAVIKAEHRASLGMHYTSVPNIMKLIEPLFLNELYEEFNASKYDPKRLNKLLDRISKIKFFDPACGSANFLIITYKEIRLLEIKILRQLHELQKIATGFEPHQLELIPKAQLTLAASFQFSFFSRIELTQFYGIELDDFAHEIAILSLWLAEHQMNQLFFKEFGSTNPALPLKENDNIVHGNATRLNWEIVCPKNKGDEIYILGNPPYLGSSMQNADQKEDMSFVFKGVQIYKNLDYITAWFLKGAYYIQNHNAMFAFVSTNSICQGEQVALLWPEIFDKSLEIGFAHTSFKWINNAKANAGVSVIIIGLRNISTHNKYLFSDNRKVLVNNINAYLTNGKNIIIEKKNKILSSFPEMVLGNAPKDGGNLLLNLDEKNSLISNGLPTHLIKNYKGAFELINNVDRFCLWFSEKDYNQYNSIVDLNRRFENVRVMRDSSPKKATQDYSNKPYRFIEIRHQDTLNSIIIPSVSSSRREYLPCGILDSNTIVSNSAQVIYSFDIFIFSILSSLIHLTWVRAVAGYLKTDFRYSSVLCYNTFPFPPITELQKQELEQCVYRILEEREAHSEKTLAQLYDPDKMPDGLREAHRLNDLAVERCYRSKPFESDEERLAYLFKLYEQMIAEEKTKGTLFADEKKSKKTKKK
jgi:hypothetical protein